MSGEALGKPIANSEKVQKILREPPSEWDPQVTAIMEAKDLDAIEFSSLTGLQFWDFLSESNSEIAWW